MNKFKDNSRFASLIDETKGNRNIYGKKIQNNEKEILKPVLNPVSNPVVATSSSNSFKNAKPLFQRDNNRRTHIAEMIEMQEKAEKEEEKKRKEIEKKAALAMESFPELVTSAPKIVENTCNFLEKVQTKSNLVKQVHPVLQKGWTELGQDTKSLARPKPKPISRIKECNQDMTYEVFDHLVYLHEKRTNEYIESWGQDEWENMFLFPSYDYYYFDKLDEIYAKNNPEYQEEFSDYDYDCEYE